MKYWICFIATLMPALGWAQPFSVDWFKVAGGGGTSTGGVFSVTDTIGQHDAGGPMQGGGFQATLGFWSLVGQQVAPPVILSQPQYLSLVNRTSASFAVSAVGTTPLFYQWQQNGANLANGAGVSGSTSSNLTLVFSATNNPGFSSYYSVVVANAFGSVTSSVAFLNLRFAPAITLQPTNTAAALGGATTLGVGVAGTGPFSYQWLFNGVPVVFDGMIITVAGGGVNDGGPATNGVMDPWGTAVDAAGNIYISDSRNNRIRKVGTNGIITTVAGNGRMGYSGDGGAATNATFNEPSGLTVDSAGNLFIADDLNASIRKVSTNGIITTVAGGGLNGYSSDNIPATNALLYQPAGVAVDGVGNLFIADEANQRIRKVDTNGIITTVAGMGGIGAFAGDGGAAINASLSGPFDVAADSSGNLFIADRFNARIRKVSTGGIITTVAGGGASNPGDGGPATNAVLSSPASVVVDSTGNLFIADNNNRIRKVDTGGMITTVAGNGTGGYSGDGGLATSANLNGPQSVAVDSAGNLFIADESNQRVRKVNTGGIISTVAGAGSYYGDGGAAINANLNTPETVALDAAGNLFITDRSNNRVRKVGTNGIITTVAGNGIASYSGDNGAATNASLTAPFGAVLDARGVLYVSDDTMHVRKINTNGVITTVAGNGNTGYNFDNIPATSASLTFPHGLALDGTGNLFIADSDNQRIRKVNTNGIITTVAGSGFGGYSGDGGAATGAQLSYPNDVAVDPAGNLFIADTFSSRIRKVGTNGMIATVAGGGTFYFDGIAATNAYLNGPFGVAPDTLGNFFIADTDTGRIRKVDINGIITTVAGNSGYGYNGDYIAATSASLYNPYSVAVDAAGNLLIADTANNRIREVIKSGFASMLTNGSLVLNNTTVTNAGSYQVVITGTYGSVTSSIIAITIPPVIVSAPGNQTNVADANCQSMVPDLRGQLVVTNGSGAITIGQTPAPGTIVGLGITNITLTATDASNNVASATVVLTVLDMTPPAILACATNRTIALGDFATTTLPDLRGEVGALDCGGVTISEWPVPGTVVGMGTNLVTLTAADPSGNTNFCTALVAVVPTAPHGLSSPGNFTVSPGGAATFGVSANGTPPFSYQWRLNGVNIPGANSTTYTVPNADGTNAGSYTVVVCNAADCATSNAGTLTVLGLDIHPVLHIYGPVGATYRVDYSEDLGAPTNWTTITNIVLPSSPYLFPDPTPARQIKRFYRAVLQ